MIDISSEVKEIVRRSGVESGIGLVFTVHTTAAVTINENADPDVPRDMLSGLRRMVPDGGYRHAEGNSPAHIKSSLFGCSQQVMISGGVPVLGTWQGIYFCEFDGPRQRRVWVTVLKKEKA